MTAIRAGQPAGAARILLLPLIALSMWPGCERAERGAAAPPVASAPAPTPEPTLAPTPVPVAAPERVLQARLADFEQKWRNTTPPARVKMYDDFVKSLRTSGITARALNVGATAPLFTLPSTEGAPVALADLLKQGPVVLLWYRGGWCPFCTLELRAYAEALPRFQELGATVVAISPQSVDNALMTQQLGQFSYALLSDLGNVVARQYGLVYKLAPEVLADVRGRVNLEEYNGDDSYELPLAATYVIGTDGTIRYAFIDADYRKRAEPEDVVAVLKTLRAGKPEAAADPAVRLRCEITLRAPVERKVDVTLDVAGLAPERRELRLELPQDWAFVRLPEPLLDGAVRAQGGERALPIERTGPYAWTVQTGGAADIRLAYTVPLTHRELEAVRGRHEFEYPFVTQQSAFLPTGPLVLVPQEVRAQEIRVRLNVPDKWAVYAPWPRADDGDWVPPSLTALQNDLVAVGQWNRQEIRAGGFVGTIVFAPGQAAIEEAFVAPVTRIIEHELRLFGRPAQGQYLFVVGPPIERGMGGSPKTNSMVLGADPRMMAQGIRHVAHLIAHEFFHTWGGERVHLPDELRWVNEGITDYYAYLVCARLGLISWPEFAEVLAEQLQAVERNPQYGQMSLADAGGPVFFQDDGARELVYQGGLIIGAWLDRTIRAGKRGKSLDDFMRAFMNDPRWVPDGPQPTLADFAALLPPFVSQDVAERVMSAVREPYRLDPVAAFGTAGVTVRRTTGPASLDLRANVEGTMVRDLDHNGLAYQLGLREFDRIVALNGQVVTNPNEVHAAWRQPHDGRVRAKIMRGDEPLDIDAPLPTVTRYEVPAEGWGPQA